MPNCREIRNAIDLVSNRTELATDVELHLTTCSECSEHARSNFQLLSLLVSQPRVAVPSDFDFHLRARIARARDEQRGWRGTLAQLWSNSFSWAQAGAAAAVLMAVTLSAGYYVRTRENATTEEIAKVASTPQTGQPLTTAPTQTPDALVTGSLNSPTAIGNRNSTAPRVASQRSNAIGTAAATQPVVEVASSQIPASQEILVYQPSQGGRPAGARSIVIPRRGQVAFGAQLASVRDVNTRPTTGTIETF